MEDPCSHSLTISLRQRRRRTISGDMRRDQQPSGISAVEWETISIITNLKASGEIVYQMLKSRADIERSYDTFKNTIHADRTYMRDDQQLQGRMFVNFIALVIHYRICSILKEKDMLKRYSPEDVIEHLKRVSMLKIGDEWKISEIPKKSRDIIDELGIPIMQRNRS